MLLESGDEVGLFFLDMGRQFAHDLAEEGVKARAARGHVVELLQVFLHLQVLF